VFLAPDVIQKGRVIDTMVQQVDILPTVFDMMGWDIPETVQGRSLLPAIQGQSMEDMPVYAESVDGGYQSKPNQRSTFIRSVRTRDWKLIANASPRGEDFAELDWDVARLFEHLVALTGFRTLFWRHAPAN
jgi:arylsulfatase A-like enzyme